MGWITHFSFFSLPNTAVTTAPFEATGLTLTSRAGGGRESRVQQAGTEKKKSLRRWARGGGGSESVCVCSCSHSFMAVVVGHVRSGDPRARRWRSVRCPQNKIKNTNTETTHFFFCLLPVRTACCIHELHLFFSFWFVYLPCRECVFWYVCGVSTRGT